MKIMIALNPRPPKQNDCSDPKYNEHGKTVILSCQLESIAGREISSNLLPVATGSVLMLLVSSPVPVFRTKTLFS